MNKQQRLDHARNNEAASKALLRTGQFNDWVITTTFYSALHYLCHDFFPMTVVKDGASIEITTIEQYIQHYNIEKSRHRSLCDLAMAKNQDVAVEYNYLMDLCMQARYRNYRFKDKTVAAAMGCLVRIKSLLSIPDIDSAGEK